MLGSDTVFNWSKHHCKISESDYKLIAKFEPVQPEGVLQHCRTSPSLGDPRYLKHQWTLSPGSGNIDEGWHIQLLCSNNYSSQVHSHASLADLAMT